MGRAVWMWYCLYPWQASELYFRRKLHGLSPCCFPTHRQFFHCPYFPSCSTENSTNCLQMCCVRWVAWHDKCWYLSVSLVLGLSNLCPPSVAGKHEHFQLKVCCYGHAFYSFNWALLLLTWCSVSTADPVSWCSVSTANPDGSWVDRKGRCCFSFSVGYLASRHQWMPWSKKLTHDSLTLIFVIGYEPGFSFCAFIGGFNFSDLLAEMQTLLQPFSPTANFATLLSKLSCLFLKVRFVVRPSISNVVLPHCGSVFQSDVSTVEQTKCATGWHCVFFFGFFLTE